jgi:hypothetical protein
LLSHLSKYSETKNFDALWEALMPMFKNLAEFVFILSGIRRFIHLSQREKFDKAMKKHFIVD